MNFSKEISAYHSFCKVYFNNFYSVNNQILSHKNTLRIFQIIDLFQIIHDYKTDNKLLPIFAEMCLDTLYNLLIAIQTNNDLFIASCTRQFDEELLKIVYSEFCNDKNTISIQKINYRSLWEDGICSSKAYKQLSQTKKDDKRKGIVREKDKIDAINNFFGKDSNKLHFKYQPDATSKYLEKIVRDGVEFDKTNLNSHLIAYYNFCIDLLPLIIKLEIDNMSISQKHEYINLINNLV